MDVPGEQEASVAPAGRGRWDRNTSLFAWLVAIQGAFGFSLSLFLILPKYLTVDLHADSQLVGFVMAVAAAASLAVTPWVGNIVTRFSYAGTLTMAGILMVLGSLTFLGIPLASAGTIVEPGFVASCGRVLQGVASALTFAAGSGAVSVLAPPMRLGQYMGIYSSANMIAATLAPPMAEWALAHGGPTSVFLLAAFVAAGAAAMAIFGLRDRLPQVTPLSATSGSARSVSVRRFVVFAIFGLAASAIFTFYQPIAIARGARHVSIFLVVYTLSALAVRLPLGRLPDRLGYERVSGAMLLLYGLSTTALFALGPETLVTFGMLLGVAHGLLFPSFLALCLHEAPPGKQAAAMATANAAFSVGSLGVWPLGAFARGVGYNTTFVVVGVIATAAATTLMLSWRSVLARLTGPPSRRV